MSSLKARYNTTTKADKVKRRGQSHFNRGIRRSSSIISGAQKITSLETKTQKQTDDGVISELFKCTDFEIFSELMAPGVSTGKKIAVGNLVIIVQGGSLSIGKNDGIFKLSTGDVFTIEDGSSYHIATTGDWVNLLKIQTPEFDEISEQVTKGTSPRREILDSKRAIAAQDGKRRERRKALAHSRNIAKQVKTDKVRAMRARGKSVDPVFVNAAGTPI